MPAASATDLPSNNRREPAPTPRATAQLPPTAARRPSRRREIPPPSTTAAARRYCTRRTPPPSQTGAARHQRGRRVWPAHQTVSACHQRQQRRAAANALPTAGPLRDRQAPPPHQGGSTGHPLQHCAPAVPALPLPVGMSTNCHRHCAAQELRAANASSVRHPPRAVTATHGRHKATLTPPRRPSGSARGRRHP